MTIKIAWNSSAGQLVSRSQIKALDYFKVYFDENRGNIPLYDLQEIECVQDKNSSVATSQRAEEMIMKWSWTGLQYYTKD